MIIEHTASGRAVKAAQAKQAADALRLVSEMVSGVRNTKTAVKPLSMDSVMRGYKIMMAEKEKRQKEAAFRRLCKLAASIEKGNILTRVPGHLLGGIYNTVGLTPALTRDLSPYREGDIEDERAVLEAFEKEHPQELGDVKVIHGGGTRLLDTLKRHFTNKRTGVIGKTLGLPTTLSSAAIGGLLRQPVYSPFADEIYAPWDNPGVTSHELGHAIDYTGYPTVFCGRFRTNILIRKTIFSQG